MGATTSANSDAAGRSCPTTGQVRNHSNPWHARFLWKRFRPWQWTSGSGRHWSQAGQFRGQLIAIHGLIEISGRAQRECHIPGTGHTDHRHRYTRKRSIGLQRGEDGPTIHTGHHNVECDEIRTQTARQFESGVSVRCDGNQDGLSIGGMEAGTASSGSRSAWCRYTFIGGMTGEH